MPESIHALETRIRLIFGDALNEALALAEAEPLTSIDSAIVALKFYAEHLETDFYDPSIHNSNIGVAVRATEIAALALRTAAYARQLEVAR